MNNLSLQETHVALAEKLLKVTFPPFYRQILLGKRILHPESRWDVMREIKLDDSSDNSGTHEDKFALYNHLVEVNKSARIWGQFPSLALAVAEDGCGDFLVLQVSHILEDNHFEYFDAFYSFDHSDEDGYLHQESLEVF
jgi:hypothetical protein